MKTFPWAEQLGLNPDPNWQIKTFTNLFLDIMSNFIPNEMMTSGHYDLPWIDKTIVEKKDKHYGNYKNHGYRDRDKATLGAVCTEYKESIEAAKKLYHEIQANSLNNSNTTPISYWKIIYRVMNKSRAPKIP